MNTRAIHPIPPTLTVSQKNLKYIEGLYFGHDLVEGRQLLHDVLFAHF